MAWDEEEFEHQEVDDGAREVSAAVDTPAPETAKEERQATGEASAEASTPSQEEVERAELEYAGKPLRPGEVREAVIERVSDDGLWVDVQAKSSGFIPLHEIWLPGGASLQETFHEGDRILAYVLNVDESNPVLSQKRARARQAWKKLQEEYESGTVIEAKVTEQVKGGLVLDVGVRAFMPASHVERGYVNDLSPYVGQTLRAKVIELDRNKNRVILSRKVVLEEEYQRAREETWSRLEEGQVVRGVVKGLTDFGAFIDLGGVDGLLHISEMGWGRVKHASDVLSVGDEVDVKVLRLDRERERISLGLKELLPDPWANVELKYPIGSVVDGTVVRIASFGAFVELEPGVEGLVHISQLADHHVNDPREVVAEGEQVKVKVLRVQPDERRISLSIREAMEPEEWERPERPAPSRRERPERGERGRHRGEAHGDFSSGNQGVTIGDMFGDLLTRTKHDLENEERRNGGQGRGEPA
ncbi:MAG: 30S ribosomal protein S1 [Bacillota bacterium]|nr:30S ribosomal protein S1 [Bacillota bacterium]